MFRFIKRVVLAAVIVAVALVAIQPENLQALGQTIRFHIKLWDLWTFYSTPPFPVALLFGVFFLLGLVVAGFHGIFERIARRAEVRKRDRRIRELEKELERLRKQLAELPPPPSEPSPPAQTGPAAPPAAAPPEEEPTL
ncbi:LapA family protein [Deferrisoma camini]|uniref:LapA family protein n=1 Tax=Deferrisoma camini TaxID=1035120 RepID=UPI00046CD4A2|nr:LapA family protein [Deferrisoma camini]